MLVLSRYNLPSVRTKEDLVNDQPSQVDTFFALEVIDQIADTDKHKSDEESGKHGNGPESSSTSFHQEDSRDCTNQERTTTDKTPIRALVPSFHTYRVS